MPGVLKNREKPVQLEWSKQGDKGEAVGDEARETTADEGQGISTPSAC